MQTWDRSLLETEITASNPLQDLNELDHYFTNDRLFYFKSFLFWFVSVCLLICFARHGSTLCLVHNDWFYTAGVEKVIQKLEETEGRE